MLCAAVRLQAMGGELLAAGNRSQIVEERWVRNAGGVGAVDGGLAFSAKRGNGKRHGDAMITEGIEFGAVQTLAAENAQAVGTLVDLGAHLAQVGGNGSDAIGFLDSQLFGIAHFESIVGVGRDGGEDWNFVDKGSGVGSGDGPTLPVCALSFDRSHKFAMMLLDLRDRNLQSHLHEDVKQTGAGWIHQNAGQRKLGAREQCRGTEKEGSAGKIAGNMGFDGREHLAATNMRRVAVALDLNAECLKREFSVIAGTNGLFDNSIAAGEESGKEDAGFHL